MDDGWKGDSGERWASPEMDRCTRRFRYHVRTKTNPRGRIRREDCVFADGRYGACTENAVIEAHHPEHERPFFVAWLCPRHHRMVDHGSAQLRARDYWDYTSLVAPLLRPELQRPIQRVRKQVADDEIPF